MDIDREHRRMRFLELMKVLGISQAEVARRTGLDASYISRLLSEPTAAGHKNLGDSATTDLVKGLGLMPGWFDLPLGSALPDDGGVMFDLAGPDDMENPVTVHEDELEIREFETGGSMGHGVVLRDQPGVIQSWRVNREWLNKNVRGASAPANLCIVTGFGDSMKPLFNPGDPLLVDIGMRTVEFDSIYFFRVANEGFIKRLQRIPGEGLRVLSANRDNYEPWTIKPDMDFEVFGRVLKVWKGEDF